MNKNYVRKIKLILSRHGFRPESGINVDESSRFNGIVLDKNGDKFFLKAAETKSYAHKSLFAESEVTRYISDLTEKKQIKYRGYRLYVPTVVSTIESNGFFCLITKFVSGKRLTDAPSEKKAEILFITSELVTKLNSSSYIKCVLPYLKKYTGYSMLVLLPLRLLKAISLSPLSAPDFIYLFWKSLSLFPRKNLERGVIHADINASNIILNGTSITLTDWEETGRGILLYNVMTPLCVHWNDEVVRDFLLKKLRRSYSEATIISLLAYRTLMLLNQHINKTDYKRKRDLLIASSITSL